MTGLGCAYLLLWCCLAYRTQECNKEWTLVFQFVAFRGKFFFAEKKWKNKLNFKQGCLSIEGRRPCKQYTQTVLCHSSSATTTVRNCYVHLLLIANACNIHACCFYFCDLDLDLDPIRLTYKVDMTVLKMYLHSKKMTKKVNFLRQGFQMLEHYKRTERAMQLKRNISLQHLRVVKMTLGFSFVHCTMC